MAVQSLWLESNLTLVWLLINRFAVVSTWNILLVLDRKALKTTESYGMEDHQLGDTSRP